VEALQRSANFSLVAHCFAVLCRPFGNAALINPPAPAVQKTTQRTSEGGNDLVSRLNDSAKRKQLSLLKAKERTLAEQMAEAPFAPAISERSRELAAANRALPERVAALMRKKKAKLDKIRLEREQKEMEEATFRPAINAESGAGADANDGTPRRVSHLMQYEVDRRIRQEQRKILISEMEDRSLTFAPALNKNSLRIVERLKASLATSSATVDAAVGVASSATASARAAARVAAGLGLKEQAGHEEETFHPRINPRSKALQQKVGSEGVYQRLYKKPADLGASGADADADDKSSPQYFNMVAYDGVTGKHDFILRRLLSAAGAANAML
jgi:hypothetical protein